MLPTKEENIKPMQCAVMGRYREEEKKRTIFVKRAAGSQVYIPEVSINVTTPRKNINHVSHVTFNGKATIYLINVVCCFSFFSINICFENVNKTWGRNSYLYIGLERVNTSKFFIQTQVHCFIVTLVRQNN